MLRRRIYFGFVLIFTTWLIVMLTLLLSCRPLYKYWQIYPNPGSGFYPSLCLAPPRLTYGNNSI